MHGNAVPMERCNGAHGAVLRVEAASIYHPQQQCAPPQQQFHHCSRCGRAVALRKWGTKNGSAKLAQNCCLTQQHSVLLVTVTPHGRPAWGLDGGQFGMPGLQQKVHVA